MYAFIAQLNTRCTSTILISHVFIMLCANDVPQLKSFLRRVTPSILLYFYTLYTLYTKKNLEMRV